MHKEVEDYIRLQRKLFVLKYATLFKTNQEAYLACGVPRSTFYDWKKAYDEAGEEGLKQKKPGDRHHPGKLSQEVVDKILELRKIYKLGSIRITWYLDRYHGIKTSESSVRRILVQLLDLLTSLLCHFPQQGFLVHS
jgi:transposase